MRWPLAAVGVLSACTLVGAAVVVAAPRSARPARCAPGMIPLGPRCCGGGQHLEGGRCRGKPETCAHGMDALEAGCVARRRVARIGGGLLRVGFTDWEALGAARPLEAVISPFGLDTTEVTESLYAVCVAKSACNPIELTGEPGRAVSRVTAREADRYCAFAGGALPTVTQLAFAAAGERGRRYPWGDTGVVCRRAAFGLVQGPCAWGADGPELVGSHPDGASPDGLQDLAGNVAEWASSPGGYLVWGGSFEDSLASTMRSWRRAELPPETRSPAIGFRCASIPSPP